MANDESTQLDPTTDGTESGTDQKDIPSAKSENKIPQHRFDEVNGKYREYADLGLSPADIREMYAHYVALVEKEQTSAPSGKPKSTMDDAKREELRKGLLEIAPELADIPGLLESVKRTQATASSTEHQQITQLNERAAGTVERLFESEGFTKEDHGKLYARIEDVVAKDVYNDPDKFRRFRRGDLSVVTETFQEVKDDILAHVVKPAKSPTKDLSFVSGKKGLTLPASPLDKKISEGKPLTRDELMQMHRETFAHMQSADKDT